MSIANTRLALVCAIWFVGCETPEERWFNSEREHAFRTESIGIQRGALVMEMRYTLPKDVIYTVKTGERPDDTVISGAKDVAMGLVNALGMSVDPWFAAIPVVGYVSSAIVQKVGDTSFVSWTLVVPLDSVKSVSVEFETDGGRKDVKRITVNR